MAATELQAIGDGLTWAALRAAMERAVGRSRAWRDAGLWALRALEAKLGPDWPQTVARKADGHAGELVMAAGHVIAYTSLLELALRLELLKEVGGFGKARQAIASDPRPGQLAHSRIQLEVAGLALMGGSPLQLEPNPMSGRPADVAFRSDGEDLVVETRAVLTSDAWRDGGRRTDELFERIHALERTYGVRCVGEIHTQLSESEGDELVRALEDHARLIGIGASAPPLRLAGTALNVVPESHAAGGGLRGPAMRGDSWTRIGQRVAEKAERALESGANWLRLDAFNGLWQFTQWASRPLAEKLEDIAKLVRMSLGPLDGVIVSSGALLAQGDFDNDEVSLADGLVGLRRVLTPVRVRETLIIAAPDEPHPAVEAWRRMYADEPQWLAWALDRLGLPTPDAVFAQ